MAFHFSAPPSGFTSLHEASCTAKGSIFSVIGVCVDFLPPAPSRGTDLTLKFTLHDHSWSHGRGMTFRFFAKSEDMLPAIRVTGDVVMLKNIKHSTFVSTPLGMSTPSTAWAVVSNRTLLDSVHADCSDVGIVASQNPYNRLAYTVAHLQYAKQLVNQTDPAQFRVPSKQTSLETNSIIEASGGQPLPPTDKFRLVKDLQLDKTNQRKFADGRPAFADLIGEVRKMYTGSDMRVDVQLTDYTSNSKLYNYSTDPSAQDGDEFGYISKGPAWQGPWGRMTIEVALFDGHGHFARSNVKEGTFVQISNCHIKIDPQGSRLEAVCRGDRDDPLRVHVSILEPHEAADNDRFKELLQRKREYEKGARAKGLPIGQLMDYTDKKRFFDASTNGGVTTRDRSDKPGRMTRSKKKKQNRKAQQQAAAAATVAAGRGTAEADHAQSPTVALNQNVRCNKVEIPLTSIDDILDAAFLKRTTAAGNELYLPFQNCAYRSNAQVVDYWPSDTRDFAVPYLKSQYESLSDDEDDVEHQEDISFESARRRPDAVAWEWRFILIVEEAGSRSDTTQPRRRMPLLVAGSDGECLLKEDACDLRNDERVFNSLREKLFILWGDLQERKEEAGSQEAFEAEKVRSMPFECLVQEYGVPLQARSSTDQVCTDYQRMFRMFGTTLV